MVLTSVCRASALCQSLAVGGAAPHGGPLLSCLRACLRELCVPRRPCPTQPPHHPTTPSPTHTLHPLPNPPTDAFLPGLPAELGGVIKKPDLKVARISRMEMESRRSEAIRHGCWRGDGVNPLIHLSQFDPHPHPHPRTRTLAGCAHISLVTGGKRREEYGCSPSCSREPPPPPSVTPNGNEKGRKKTTKNKPSGFKTQAECRLVSITR